MNRYWQITMEDRARESAIQLRSNGIYNHHFGLRSVPFGLTPDTRFLYEHASFREALNTLIIAVRSGEGFSKVTGEVGTGKTMLCRRFLNLIEGEFVTAFIPNPYLEPMTLLLAIADEIGLRYPDHVNQHQLLKSLNYFLVETFDRQRKSVVVCLDEAHALPIETLEALRLLSNLDTERRKLLQIVLFGQPELNDHLDQPVVRQLKQRISFSSVLTPLTFVQTQAYVQHRLKVAEYQGRYLLTRRAQRLLYRASGGIPRLINILTHKALAAAYGEGLRYVGERHMRLAAADTEAAKPHLFWARQHRWRTIAGVIAAASALGGAFTLGTMM